jgi:PAS domain S-box-containing protein
MESFIELEDRDVHNNVDRVILTMNNDADSLERTLKDWASWDDTYYFLDNGSQSYIDSNLAENTFDTLGIDFMLFMNDTGGVVFGISYDETNGTLAPVPESVVRVFSNDTKALIMSGNVLKGIVSLPEGAVLISAMPVLKSDNSGPSNGIMAIGKYIDNEYLYDLSGRVLLPVYVFNENDIKNDNELTQIQDSLSYTHWLTKPVDDNRIYGYGSISDIYGHQGILVRIGQQRSIYQQGRDSIVYFIFSLIIVGSILMLTVLFIFEKYVLSRIDRLNKSVSSIGVSRDLMARVPIDGNDEVSRLGIAVNGMLSSIEQSRDKLYDSEIRYHSLFMNMLNAFAFHEIVLDDKGEPVDYTYLEVNGSFEELTGLKRENIIGRKVTGVIPGIRSLKFDWIKEYGRVALTGESLRTEQYFEPLNKWFSISAYSTKKNYFAVVFYDITEQKMAEQALMKSEAHFRTLMETVASAVIIIQNNRICYANPAAEQVTGFFREELYSMGFNELMEHIHGDYRKLLIDRSIARLTGKKTISRYEIKIITKYKELKWVDATSSLIEFNGKPAILTTGFDVTERKHTEKALKQSEEKFKSIYTQSPIGIQLYDVNGNIKDANIACLELLGVSSIDNIRDFNLFKHSHMSDDEKARLLSGKVLRHESSINFDNVKKIYPLKTSKSGIMYIDTLIVPIGYEESPFKGYLVHVQDITERKLADKKLHDSEFKLRQVTDNMRDMITHLDTNGTILYASPSHKYNLGYGIDSLIGRNAMEFIHPDDIALVKNEIKELMNRGRNNSSKGFTEFRFLTSSGEYIWLESTGNTIFGENGNVLGAIINTRDITERKIVDDRLKASLNEKEILLKEIHHRVKNNLQIVSSLLDLQSMSLKERGRVEMYKESQNRIRTMALIHEKLYKSRDLSRIDFEDYVKSLASDLYRAYNANTKDINLYVNVDKVLITIDTAIPCGLIINELVSNSLKYAFPHGKGEISISLKSNGNGHVLTVKDNGIGMPDNFDANNTTSLGLQLVNTLTEQLKGHIELKKENGTEFKITFTGLKDREMV